MITTPLAPALGATECRRAALDKLFSRLSEVSSLPIAAQRIIELAASDQASIADLRDEIQRDPALTARVLRRVNSAYYGLRSPVADLAAAVNLLGFGEVRNLALTVFVARLFQGPSRYKCFTREALWQHCLGVACAARMVAVVSRRSVPGEAYVAGMLHDLGLILLAQHLPKQFERLIDCLTPQVPTWQAERDVYTFDHAELGGHVCQKWRFPEQISAAVAWHHQPELYAGPHRELVYVVAIANSLCSRAGWTSLGIDNSVSLPANVYTQLGLDRPTLMAISQELGPTLAKATALAAVG